MAGVTKMNMCKRALWAYILWIYTLGHLPGASNQTLCGRPHEEGTSQTLTCSTQDQAFDKFGPRIKTADGRMFETGYCDSDGKCQDSNPSQFEAFFSHEQVSSTKAVTVRVKNVHRGMTGMICYMNGTPLFETECIMIVYVHPIKPICTAVTFRSGEEEGTDAFLSCTTERTDLLTECGMEILVNGTERFKENHRLSVDNSDASRSVKYPGYPQLTCRFRILLVGIPENTYTLIAGFNAYRPGIQLPRSLADPIPPLKLKATALLNPSDSNRRETFDPKSGQLKLSIPVISNPPPNRYGLSMRPADSSAGSDPVSNQHYSVMYSSSAIETLTGTIELTVANTAVSGGHGTAVFTFVADNGVVGSSEFEVVFTADNYDLSPTQPTCSSPEFVDGGATALIRCRSDRMNQTGACRFHLMGMNLSLSEEPIVSTDVEDSTNYPGKNTVTCELRLPIAGNRPGDYQFQVVIASSETDGNMFMSATTPVLKLRSITLHDPAQNNHVFNRHDSEELTVYIHVTGSPEPNRVTLFVKEQSQNSSSAPVPSRDFHWTFTRTADSGVGYIELSITGGLDFPGISGYTVKAENGVEAENKFEYNFYVKSDTEASLLAHRQESPAKHYYMLLIAVSVVSGLVIFILIALVVLLLVRNRRRPQDNAPGDGSKPDEDVELKEHLKPDEV